jgi:hypothetical protein
MARLIGTTMQYSFLSSPTFINAHTYDAASNWTARLPWFFQTPALTCHIVAMSPSRSSRTPGPRAPDYDFTESGMRPFSSAHFLGHGFGLIPAPGSFAASAFPVPP